MLIGLCTARHYRFRGRERGGKKKKKELPCPKQRWSQSYVFEWQSRSITGVVIFTHYRLVGGVGRSQYLAVFVHASFKACRFWKPSGLRSYVLLNLLYKLQKKGLCGCHHSLSLSPYVLPGLKQLYEFNRIDKGEFQYKPLSNCDIRARAHTRTHTYIRMHTNIRTHTHTPKYIYIYIHKGESNENRKYFI